MQKARHQVLAGRPLVLPLETAAGPVSVEINPPTGETLHLSSRPGQGPLSHLRRGHQEFRYTDTHQIGIYKLRPLEGPGARPVGYSVNLDPEEADPARIDREELQDRLAPCPLVFADDPDDLAGTLARLREGKSLWELFLVGVLIVLVFETFVSNRLSPKQEKDQGEQPPPGMRRLARKGRAGGASS